VFRQQLHTFSPRRG